MYNFASLSDVNNLFRTLTTDEETKAGKLLGVVSNRLRVIAMSKGKDLDAMAEEDYAYAETLKSVVVDVVGRALMTPTSGAPMSQFSESGMGYVQSGTYLVPGGGVFIKDAELKALGLKRQRVGYIDMLGGE